MNKKGFTLIELLAVIVILAIIAVIAVPIVLNIIDETKENANKRSIDMYAKALENAVASYKLNGNSLSGTFTTTDGKTVVSSSDSNIKLNVDYSGSKVVCDTFEIYEDAKFYLSDCKVDDILVDNYSNGKKQVIKGLLNSVCRPVEKQYFAENPIEPGYKYECDVDPSKEGYDNLFYVLNSTETSVNLIMDRNIFSSPWITKDDYINKEIGGSEEYWVSSLDGDDSWKHDEGAIDKGPITALNQLKLATSNWTNLLPMTLNVFESYYGNKLALGKTYNIHARMPYKSEVKEYSSSLNNAYLYDNMEIECWNSEKSEEISCDQSSDITGIYVEGIEHSEDIMY